MKKAYIIPTERVVLTEPAFSMLTGSDGDEISLTSGTDASNKYGTQGDNSDAKAERGWSNVGW